MVAAEWTVETGPDTVGAPREPGHQVVDRELVDSAKQPRLVAECRDREQPRECAEARG